MSTRVEPRRPPIDPRIRARRVEVLREQGRRRLRALLVLVSAATLAGIAWLVVESPLLAVRRVTVTGVHELSAEAVRRAAGVSHGTALLRVDVGVVSRRVEAMPWVARASVQRDLPHVLRIRVVERVPVAWARVAAPAGAPSGPAWLVDSTGRVLAASPQPPAGLPELRGLGVLPAPGRTITPRAAAALLSQLPAELRVQVASVVMRGGAATLVLAPPAKGAPPAREVRLGLVEDVPAKGVAAVAVLAQLVHQPVAYLDVRVPDAPVTG